MIQQRIQRKVRGRKAGARLLARHARAAVRALHPRRVLAPVVHRLDDAQLGHREGALAQHDHKRRTVERLEHLQSARRATESLQLTCAGERKAPRSSPHWGEFELAHSLICRTWRRRCYGWQHASTKYRKDFMSAQVVVGGFSGWPRIRAFEKSGRGCCCRTLWPRAATLTNAAHTCASPAARRHVRVHAAVRSWRD